MDESANRGTTKKEAAQLTPDCTAQVKNEGWCLRVFIGVYYPARNIVPNSGTFCAIVG